MQTVKILIAFLMFCSIGLSKTDLVGVYTTVFTKRCFDKNHYNPCDTIINKLTLNKDSTFSVIYNHTDTTFGSWSFIEEKKQSFLSFSGLNTVLNDSLVVEETQDSSRETLKKKLKITDFENNPLDEIFITLSHDSVTTGSIKVENGSIEDWTSTTYPISIHIASSEYYSGVFNYIIKDNTKNLFVFKIQRHRVQLFLNETWIFKNNRLYSNDYDNLLYSNNWFLQKVDSR